jgi:hypothetical protein
MVPDVTQFGERLQACVAGKRGPYFLAARVHSLVCSKHRVGGIFKLLFKNIDVEKLSWVTASTYCYCN